MPVRSEALRWTFQLVAAVAPQRIKHMIYRRILGWDVHPTARFGLSLIAVERFSAGEGVTVSHLNVIKGCDEVRLGARAVIGPLNWITSPPRKAGLFPSSPKRRPGLVMGDAAAITTRHVLSCVDEVIIEPYAILGGLQSRIVTHGPNYLTATMATAPVRIGHHSLVTTNCTLLAGSVVPPRCIVAAGATVPGPLSEELAIYGGTPARKLKDLPADAVLFTRERGRLFD